MLEQCNTAHAPWYVVPSDHKKYRNWAVGELLRETLESSSTRSTPTRTSTSPRCKARLAPPH